MGYSKQQFIEQAFEEIGLATYVFDMQPEQLQAALRRLDSMMATWNAKGIRLGYPLPGSPQNSDIEAATNVPDSANEAIYTNLAISLAPTMGKTVSNETKVAAKQGYNVLLGIAGMPPQMQLPRHMPAGAGNKPWSVDQTFILPPVDPLLAGPDSEIQFT